jgi:hypothetical protein
MKLLFQTYLEEFSDIKYCPYCLTIKGNRIVCCQEADFIEFKELDLDQQTQIIDNELDTYRS